MDVRRAEGVRVFLGFENTLAVLADFKGEAGEGTGAEDFVLFDRSRGSGGGLLGIHGEADLTLLCGRTQTSAGAGPVSSYRVGSRFL